MGLYLSMISPFSVAFSFAEGIDAPFYEHNNFGGKTENMS